MDVVLWTKKIAGNEWLPADDRFKEWLEASVKRLDPKIRKPMELTLEGLSAKEAAEKLGIASGTVNNYVTQGLMILRSLLGDDRSMFRSIMEFEFSDEVDGYELGMCFYGRLTRNVQESFLSRVLKGSLKLPTPEYKGGKYVWTRKQAEAWRDWYVRQR